MNVKTIIVSVLALTLVALRFTLPTHGLDFADTFKDIAHIVVGGLIGAWVVTRWRDNRDLGNICGIATIVLTIAEVVAAIIR